MAFIYREFLWGFVKRTSWGDDIKETPEDEPHTKGKEIEGTQISDDASYQSTDVLNTFSENFVQWVIEGDNYFILIWEKKINHGCHFSCD